MKWFWYFVWCFFGKPVTVITRTQHIMLYTIIPSRIVWTSARFDNNMQLWLLKDFWGGVPPAGGNQLTPDHEGIFWVKGWLISPRRREALRASAALLS